MLLDYHKAAQAKLTELRDEQVAAIINANPDKHDLHKGQINAYGTAIEVLGEVLQSFSSDEQDGAAIRRLRDANKAVTGLRSGSYYSRGRA